MTEKEAIEVITKALEQSENIIVELTNIKEIAERQQKVGEYYANLENCVKEIDSCKVAIKALEEIQQYRAIGTPEEFRDALGKQIAQLPIVRGLGQRYCPTCKCGGANDLYCSKCGQKLRD